MIIRYHRRHEIISGFFNQLPCLPLIRVFLNHDSADSNESAEGSGWAHKH